MSSPPGSSEGRPQMPPHIRLNSGAGDLLETTSSSGSSDQMNRQPSARSLTAGRPGASPIVRQGSSNSLYSNQIAESAERLLPPTRSRVRRFRDEDVSRSPSAGYADSRRTSWSSESAGSRDSRMGPFASPFDDSRAPSRAGSDDDGVNTQTVSEKYNILPSAGLLLFPEDVEKDDYLHNPDPADKDPRMTCADLFSKRGLVNVGGLTLITLGVAMLFIGYPILNFASKLVTPEGSNRCSLDPNCIRDHVPLLKNLRTSAIDPATPKSAMTKQSYDGKTLKLTFSDEFETPGRVFYPDDDPFFVGVDLWYGVTRDLEWYDPDALTTGNGTLNIRFDAFQNHNLNYRSGMLQSWNQVCFKGGMLEASISLPGNGQTIGFWPGFWAMGNLGRPGYAATTDGTWPYSYHDVCDLGITANQSDPDGLQALPGMRYPACTCDGQEHPSPGKSRSAPEIDAIEASVNFLDPLTSQDGIGSASQSFQVAPFDILWRPDTDWIEVYDASVSMMNAYQGGIYQQAVSTVTNLNNAWYDGNAYQTYSFDYTPGANGYVSWNVGEERTWTILGNAVGPNGNIGQRVMPEEPMSIIANFGMSPGFANLNFSGLATLMPATMRIDYIRIYQDSDGELTCDPVGYPTTDFIASHPKAYQNPNFTLWEQTGYEWPKNALVDSCQSSAEPSGSKQVRQALQQAMSK